VPYLIGIDEAGYGPNLGPLVVSASLWEVPDGTDDDDLYQRLEAVIAPSTQRAFGNLNGRVAVADSKLLYKPGGGLRNLERGIWTALSIVGRKPDSWRDVWNVLAPESAHWLPAIPWYADYDSAAPLDADPAELAPLATAVREGLAAADVRLLDLRSRAVFPQRFNDLVREHDSKGAALSHVTLELAARLMEPLDEQPITVTCDKHGGRNRYAPLLAEHFPERLIEIRGEGRAQSVYRFGPPERRVEFRFRAKGESSLAAALASMASKYLRELAMRAFNAFWCRRVPGLRPTAGYPQDAKRFKADIVARQKELGIEDRVLWREK